MNRIDRLTAILIHLQSRRITKGQELAERFGISLRTVYRDIRALEEAGVPIGAEAGTGYFLAEGYHLPPVMLTAEEARALLLAGKLVATFTDPSVKQPYEQALYKIRSVMKSQEQEMLDELQDKLAVVHTPSQGQHIAGMHLEKIQQALLSRRVLRIDYFSPGSATVTERLTEPVGLVHYSNVWHMIAYCRLRQDYRDFRLDRMSRLAVTEQGYHMRDRLTLEQYLQRQSQVTEAMLVKIRFHQSVVPFVVAYRSHFGFMQEEFVDGMTEMWFMVAQEEYFCRWLLMYGDGVEIVSPRRLHRTVHGLLQELQQHYHYFSKPC